jgi:hypothetical protein
MLGALFGVSGLFMPVEKVPVTWTARFLPGHLKKNMKSKPGPFGQDSLLYTGGKHV